MDGCAIGKNAATRKVNQSLDIFGILTSAASVARRWRDFAESR
jgi:hypothetical protein